MCNKTKKIRKKVVLVIAVYLPCSFYTIYFFQLWWIESSLFIYLVCFIQFIYFDGGNSIESHRRLSTLFVLYNLFLPTTMNWVIVVYLPCSFYRTYFFQWRWLKWVIFSPVRPFLVAFFRVNSVAVLHRGFLLVKH